MITSFRQDNKRKQKRLQVAILFALLLFLLLILKTPVSNLLGGAFHVVGAPFWSARLSVMEWFHEEKALVASKKSLLKENDELKDIIDRTALDAYSYTLLRQENDMLKEKFGRKPEKEFLLARVLATPGQSPFDTLVIDAGTAEGVSSGMRIFTDGDFVIGEVTSVFHHSAVVTLYSSSGTELAVELVASSTPATLYGQGGGNFLITLPRGVPVSVGDLVDIPALAPEYAAVIDAVNRPEGESLQYIYLKLPVNVYQLKWVYVASPLPLGNNPEQKTP